MWLVLAVAFGVLEVLAVWKGWRTVEFVAKPAVMACLFAWLYAATGLRGAGFWFGTGVLISVVGDIFLLWQDRFFLPGLAVFLLVHIAYLIGFNKMLPPLSLWSLLLALILGLSAARLMGRILTGVRTSGHPHLAVPVVVYGAVMTLMLLSAMLTLSNTDWKALASLLVAGGAFLFYWSDTALAWDKFVAPVRGGRLFRIGLYETGQILLIAGVVLQFS